MARGVTRGVNAVGNFVKENVPTLTSNKYYTQQEMADYEQKYGITESSKQEILEKYKSEYGTLEEALTAVTEEKSKLQQKHKDIGGWGKFYDKEDYEERERNIERLKYERDLISEALGKASVPDNIVEVGKGLLDVADVGDFFDSFGGDLVQPLNQIGDAGEEVFGETADLYAQKSPEIAGLAENVGSLIPAMVATAVSGNTTVGTAVFAMKVKNDYYHEYLGQGYTATEADNLSNIMTVVEVGSEYLGDIAGGVNILKKGALKDWASKPLSQAIKGYAIEGGEEVFAEVAGMIVTDEKLTVEEFGDRVKLAFAGGVALSIVMNSAGKAGSTIVKCKEKIANGQKLTMSEVEQVIQEQASIEGKSVEEIMDEYGDKVNELAQSSTANTAENTTLPTANQEATATDVLPKASEQKTNNTESTMLPTAKDNVLPTANEQNVENAVTKNLQEEIGLATSNDNVLPYANSENLAVKKYQYAESYNTKINDIRKDASQYFTDSEQAHKFIETLEKVITDKDLTIRLNDNVRTEDNKIANGKYDSGTVTIDPSSPKALESIAIHEVTHAIGTKSMLKIVDTYRKSNAEFNSNVQTLLDNYNVTELNEEILADVSSELFGTQEFINNVADAHPTLFQKIYSEIKYLWHQFRGYKTQGQFIEDLYFKWNQAYNSSNKLNTETIKYSRENDSKLGNYWQVDDSKDIFKGIDNVKDLQNKAYNYLFNGNNNFEYITDTIDNKQVKFARISAREYVYGRSNKNLQGNLYQEKMRTAPSIDDLIKNADITYYSPLTHSNKLFTEGFNNYQGKVGIDNDIFKYIVRIGKTGEGNNIFYDVSLELLGQKNETDNKVLGAKSSSLKSVSTKDSITPQNSDVNTTTKYSTQEFENNTTKLQDRISGDKLLDTQDFINEIKSVGAEVDENGYVTVYHQTSTENANKIKESGMMSGKEDGIFFSTSKEAQQSEGRGTEKLTFKIPAEILQLDDIFDNNADVRIPLKNKNEIIDVSKYLINTENSSSTNYLLNKEESLPKVKEGYTRLYRGLESEYNPNYDKTLLDNNNGYESWTDNYDLAKSYGENVYYIDVPTTEIKNSVIDEDASSETYGDRNLIYLNNKPVGIKGKSGNEYMLYTGHDNYNDITYNKVDVNETASDIRYSKQSNNSWQKYLEENFRAKGTRTYAKDILFQASNESKSTPSKDILVKKADGENSYTKKTEIKQEQEKIASILEKPVEKVSKKDRTWAVLKANIIDKGIVFEELSRKTNNRELQGKWDYTLTATARGQNAIGRARYEMDANTKTERQICKSLEDIRAEVGDKTSEFQQYMYHQLNIDRMTLTDRFAENSDSTIKNKPVFGNSVTAEVSKKIVNQYEKSNPEFKKWAQDVYDYNNANKQELVKSGVISQELADKLSDMYPHYVPIKRVNSKGNAINVPLDTNRTGINSPLAKAKGGNQDIQPLFETLAERTLQTYKASAKNSFGVELMNTLNSVQEKQITGVDAILEEIGDVESNNELLKEGKNGSLPTFTVFDNGEKVTFEISRDMYDALKPVSDSSILSKTIKPLNAISNARRGVLTEYNPLFLITNAIKDSQDVVINSQHSAKTYAKFPEAYHQIIKNGYWYNEYVRNGGEQNSYFKDGEFESDKKTSKLKTALKSPLDKISSVNNVIEMAPRLAEYIASRESGASIETAMLDASRVTTNFKAGGDIIKFANRNGATFLNASVQGFEQQVRNIKEANAKGLKGYAVLATKYAIAGMPALILNQLLWKDDEDYDELQDYVKDNYYIVAKYGDGKFIRIPKGRMAATMQKIVGNVAEYVTGEKELNIDNLSKDFWEDLKFTIDNVAPNNPLDNNVISPVVQAVTNKSWYGEDIVPSRLQDKPEAEQYDETIDSFSIWLGGKLNVSPYKINYLLDQYGGGVSDIILPMLTKQAENNVVEDKFTTDSVMKSKYPGEFYSKLDEVTTAGNSDKASDKDILASKYVSSVSEEMSELYKKKREIQSSDLSDKAKKTKVKEVQKRINALAQRGLESLEKFSTNNYDVSNTAVIGNEQYYKLTNVSDESKTWRKVSDDEAKKIKNIPLETYADYKEQVAQETIKQRKSGTIEEDQSLKDKDKIKILINSDYTNKEKTNIYENFILDKNDKKYETIKSTFTSNGLDITQYLEYKSQEFTSDKDDDGTVNGKSISGSKKKKVYNYIESMKATYTQKLILSALEYEPSSYSDKKLIVNYVNSLNKTAKEKLEILGQFKGVTVYKNGTYSY